MHRLSDVNIICTINGMARTGFLDMSNEIKTDRFFFTVSDRVVSTSKKDSLVFEIFDSGSFPGFLSFDQPWVSSEERLTLLSEFLKEIAVRKIQPNFYLKLSSDKLLSLTEGNSVDIEDPIPYHYTHPIFSN